MNPQTIIKHLTDTDCKSPQAPMWNWVKP